MPEYDNTNRGVLFKNTEKEAENHPDYKGSMNAQGVEFWLSAWIKVSKEGKKYMSLSMVKKEVKGQKPVATKPAPETNEDMPF